MVVWGSPSCSLTFVKLFDIYIHSCDSVWEVLCFKTGNKYALILCAWGVGTNVLESYIKFLREVNVTGLLGFHWDLIYRLQFGSIWIYDFKKCLISLCRIRGDFCEEGLPRGQHSWILKRGKGKYATGYLQ